VRLHLSFNVLEDQPAAAVITPGKTCERKIWKEQWEKGLPTLAIATAGFVAL
jgi:hypothetical protein